jgi:hypothetical protein
MRFLLGFAALFLASLFCRDAHAITSVYCAKPQNAPFKCYSARGTSEPDADFSASIECKNFAQIECWRRGTYTDVCYALASTYAGHWKDAQGPDSASTSNAALNYCNRENPEGCRLVISLCDKTSLAPATAPQPPAPSISDTTNNEDHSFDFLSKPEFYHQLFLARLIHDVEIGIQIGLGLLIVAIVLFKRDSIINHVIHGNLPKKLPVYGEDIQALFKLTQRINWYGRVIFGIVINLSMA